MWEPCFKVATLAAAAAIWRVEMEVLYCSVFVRLAGVVCCLFVWLCLLIVCRVELVLSISRERDAHLFSLWR